MSKAKAIGTALSARLANITIANGYQTDIGLRVYRGRIALDESRIPCVVIHEGEDVREDDVPNIAAVKIGQEYTIEGHLVCDADNPNDAAHDAIADIKRAVFGADLRFGNTVQKLRYNGRTIAPRFDGTALVSGTISLIASYVENLREP